MGPVSLQPHQLSAVTRIESALDEFGGALLCDEVGMGKTFVATAIARRHARRLVVAPAALSQMWTHALRVTGIDADFISFEKLSRFHSTCGADYDLLIIDEAHHARNQATRRYVRLQELSRRAELLLLTATPIHNRRKDLSALLSLFLGSRVNALTQAELARCVVRREHEQLKSTALIPGVLPTACLEISDDPRVVRELMTFPEPVPVRNGGLGRSLIARSLVHQWASSEAALKEALRRRIARAYALIASLEAGSYPTEGELRTWIFEDGALQLGFPEMLSAPTADAATLLESVRLHCNALERFRSSHSADFPLDIERVNSIASIRAAHVQARIVAFAQYTETVSMLFRGLVGLGGVAMLTARGARVAGGALSRREALSRFAPRALNATPPRSAERIDLLLSTDLLSEGVNLQDAEVVVHLDIPWTAARLEQRVGRVARMGSAHSEVKVYLIRPPASAALLLESETLVQRKWDVARRAVGSTRTAPFPERSSAQSGFYRESVTSQTEKLRAILNAWPRVIVRVGSNEVLVASVSSPRSGFVAVVSLEAEPSLIVGLDGRTSNDLESKIIVCQMATGTDTTCGTKEYEAAFQQLRHWIERESASKLAGLADSSELRRRHLINRIDAAIESAPPHTRSRRLTIAAKARRVAAAQHSGATEAELESLARAMLSDDEWLSAVAKLESSGVPTGRRVRNMRGMEIHALLVLCADKSK
ncbi:MAG: DEAD/DEAH box helicase [Gemmatimonadota bacterium]|nr:DEAD/DEAH box helicase [Gemmatimonadota bacterium]